jgi:hypothetical protein
MEIAMDVRLYGTACCHLCEEAHAILHELGIRAEHVDIAEDDELLEKYGVRIPVLKRGDTGEELGWPFDAAAVSRFLGA